MGLFIQKTDKQARYAPVKNTITELVPSKKILTCRRA
jgi:hypothetical protein